MNALLAAFATGLLTLCGCAAGAAGTGGDPPPAAVERSHAAGALVLRLQELGGLLPPGAAAAALPPFSLYGDGLVLTPAGDGRSTAYGEARLAPAEVDRLVAQAAAALSGGDLPAFDLRVADAGASRVTLVGRTGTRRMTLPALSLPPDEVGVPDAQRGRWDRLRALRTTLVGYRQRTRPVTPDRLAVLAGDGESATRTWPAGALAAGTQLDGVRCTVLTGSRAGAAGRALAAGPGTWLAGGKAYFVQGRALLPDERGCAQLGR